MSADTLCVFDIETVPDTSGISHLNRIDNLDETSITSFANLHRRAITGKEFSKHYLHKVVAISVCVKHQNKIRVASLAKKEDSESDVIQSFFSLIEKYQPTLISWNGNGFDLPVLHYRALFHGIEAKSYWDVGHFDNASKWNNYLSRYQWKHIDLMDVLSGYQMKNTAPLDDIAKLCGFPGKLETDGSDVLDLYLKNNIGSIRNYCETDVLNTYLIYLRFELMRNKYSIEEYKKLIEQLKIYLSKKNKTHLNEFLQYWR